MRLDIHDDGADMYWCATHAGVAWRARGGCKSAEEAEKKDDGSNTKSACAKSQAR